MKLSTFILFITSFQYAFAEKIISDKHLWKHVVSIDRIIWDKRSKNKLNNNLMSDHEFVRRIYLDVTGKIPTYQQTKNFLLDKKINKRSLLINQLLNSPGYASYFSIFWQNLLRHNPKIIQSNNEFTRYIEEFLYLNKPYDKIVFDLIMSEGSIQENRGIEFYLRDRSTGVFDTVNALTKAFLGIRIGCAQCHNHRFDKWLQKDFYELASFFYGIDYTKKITAGQSSIHNKHFNHFKAQFKITESYYSRYFFKHSRENIRFIPKNKRESILTYPEDYAYSNAKPKTPVTPRIIFNFGDLNITGKNNRETFAKWLTSKENKRFSETIVNRLWRKFMGKAIYEPLDDWKESIEIKNEDLLNLLNKIFIDLDFNIKAFLSIILNTEAYQYKTNSKNDFDINDYNFQGALYKRMNAPQLNDSLMTLSYGDLDSYSKINTLYFEFENKLYDLIVEYQSKVYPHVKEHIKQYTPHTDLINQEVLELIQEYQDKLIHLENYYEIDVDGLNKNHRNSLSDEQLKHIKFSINPNLNLEKSKNTIKRANYSTNYFMSVFGLSTRENSSTDEIAEPSITQILSLMNSHRCKKVIENNSYLMKNLIQKSNFNEKIKYLFYSLYSRSPTKNDLKIAEKYLKQNSSLKAWGNYILALINSPEFYFIK